MRKFRLLSTSAIGSAALFGMSFAFTAPAYAQDETDEVQTAQAETTPTAGEQNLTVTGSRIRRPNLESNVPITSVSVEDLTSQGDVSVGDALNDLPSLRSTFSQANSNRFIGTTGLNILDLRGLGVERTLVLVNGRRHITSQPGDFLVDVNTIPSDLIERVDVITGGSSAVYGSDAVAGVVNFVLRRDFDGIRLRGQGGVSQQGDRGIEFVSLTAGQNFFDDRANVAVNLEYVNAEPLYFIDRPELTGAVDGRCQFNTTDFTIGEPATGDGVPDTSFQCETRNATISNGGMLGANASAAPLLASGAPNPLFCGNLPEPIRSQRCLSNNQPRAFVFRPGGQLVENVPGLDLRPFGPANFVGGSGFGATLRDTGQLAPGLDRYTANILAHYDVSDAFRPFLEAKYVHIEALQEGQPSFFQATFPAFFGAGRGIRCDNPFLTADNISTLQGIGRCLGGSTSTETLQLARFNVDFGGRREEVERDTFRAVAGIQGDFNEDWNYELSFNYGHVDIHQIENNDLHIFDIDSDGNIVAEGPFLLAVDSVRNGAGQIVCRVNADADPTNDRPDCVPFNPFGAGAPSAAALDFVNTTSFVDSEATERNIVGFLNGDLSQLFEFPGGPVRFVIGAEWRKETAFQEADPLSAAGATFFNAFPVFDPPAFEVLEGFGEIELPLLRDLPFAHELTFTGAARYSDYNTTANHTFAYNVSGTWAPVRDIRFRGNYSQSVRVPTLGDLFTPPTQSFNFLQDPCDILFIGLNPNRAANCAAAGVPVGFVNTLARTQTTEIAFAGNPLLEEETSKSLTLGVVLTPRWVPGLSITVDYYAIDLENRIEALAAQVILNQCFDLPDLNNQFCPLVFRNPDSTFASPGVLSSGVNFAKGEADGIDFEVAYRRTFDNGHRLNVRGIATYVIKRNNFISPTNPDFSDRQLSELGDPRWAANLNITYGIGNIDLRYSMNYIGKQTIGAYEQYFSHQDRPPTNPDNTLEVFYPDVLYHAVRLNMRVDERFQFYGGVDNLFDTAPPLGLLGTGAADPFDPIGRYFYVGGQVDF